MRLTIYRDNTPTLLCSLKKVDGTIPDITGATILWAPKSDQSLPNSAAQFQKTTGGGGITITNGPLAQFKIGPLTTADTQSLTQDTTILMDILITDTTGNVFTVANYTELEIKTNISRK